MTDGEILAPAELLAPDPDSLRFLEKALQNGAGKESLKDLMDFLERLQRNRAAVKFAEAITKFQELCPPVEKCNPVYGKDKTQGPHYYFAGFDDIMDVAAGPLHECGIVVTFTTKNEGPLMTTTCRVRVGTHTEESSITLSLPQIPNANDSQRAGGAQKYGMRYAMVAALNIRVRGEDNDAQEQFAGLKEDETLFINNTFQSLLDGYSESAREKWLKKWFGWVGCTDLNDFPAKKFPDAKKDLETRLAAKKP